MQEEEEEGQEFRSLEVRGKLIPLKKHQFVGIVLILKGQNGAFSFVESYLLICMTEKVHYPIIKFKAKRKGEIGRGKNEESTC